MMAIKQEFYIDDPVKVTNGIHQLMTGVVFRVDEIFTKSKGGHTRFNGYLVHVRTEANRVLKVNQKNLKRYESYGI